MTLDFIERAHKDGKPFFVWWNPHLHHLKPESDGKTGLGIYADGMVEHDAQVSSPCRFTCERPRSNFTCEGVD